MRVLVVSDVHANPWALKAIVESERYDKAVFLGDAVDYGPRPGDVLDTLRTFDVILSGNHDYAAAHGVDCMCGQDNHDLSVYTRENITMKDLGREERSFLASLPESAEVDLDGVRAQAYHATPADHLYRYLYPWSISRDDFRDTLGREVPEGLVMVGHTHYQFLTQYMGWVIMNPGSAGQPRDNSPWPGYCVIDTEGQAFEFKRVRYEKSPLRKELRERVGDQQMLKRLVSLFRL
ncbi:metallophosphoesterase family protein [Thermogymnomonas acidicola]|nr:metallophosphoesterase family protein [Thermogymnomonas acidicola]